MILENRDCRQCDHGLQNSTLQETCPACGGTGKQVTDGRKYCRKCRRYSNGRYVSAGIVSVPGPKIACTRCNGNYRDFEPETLYDYYDLLDFPIPWRVDRHPNRRRSWVEDHLGLGLGSCTDYGRHKNLQDDELIARNRESHKKLQASKIVRKDDMKLADEIVIVTGENGYSCIARWFDNEN